MFVMSNHQLLSLIPCIPVSFVKAYKCMNGRRDHFLYTMTGKIPQQISYYESQYQRSAHVHFHTFTVYKTLEKLNIEVHNSHDITHILHTKCS